MNPIKNYDEDDLARLLGMLPPAPEAWVKAAQELPTASAALDQIMARAASDTTFRDELAADAAAALVLRGYVPSEPLVAALRDRLSLPET